MKKVGLIKTEESEKAKELSIIKEEESMIM